MALRLLILVCISVSAFLPNNPLTPMLGWSSWNTFGITINETAIQETAIAMVKNGMKDAGYRYVNIDDGFFVPRNAQGEFQYNHTLFPSGMRAMADFIHSLGLNAGFYSEGGDDTCGSMYSGQGSAGVGVGLYGHEEADFSLFFGQWDYDFIKVDFCGGRKLGLDVRDQYTKIHDAIVKTQPPNKPAIRLNLCRWIFPGTWAADVSESWRMYHDITNDFLEHDSSVVSIMKKNLYLSPYASPGHFNDMDMMEIGRNTFTNDEEQSHFALWCILSSPILIGCDLRTIPERTLKIITNPEVLAVHQDVLGLQAQVVTKGETYVVLAKPLEVAHGTVRAVALFNWGEEAAVLRVDFADIQLAGEVSVRDLYAHTDLGVYADYFEKAVAPHGILLLRLSGTLTFDKKVYDGRDAFLHDYTELHGKWDDDDGKGGSGGSVEQEHKAHVVEFAEGSGGIKIAFLGNTPTNWAEFRDVYSSTGGDYTVTIDYLSDAGGRTLEVTVNGEGPVVLEDLKGPGFGLLGTDTAAGAGAGGGGGAGVGVGAVQTVVLEKPVKLKVGANVVRLGNSQAFAPDISRVVFERTVGDKKEEDGVGGVPCKCDVIAVEDGS